MHDPLSVAFEIKSPIKRSSALWPKGYRNTLVTIWHEDPLKFKGKCGCRNDDSCGWFTPPYSPEDREKITKLAADQYRHIFERQVREAEGASYAHVCNVPDCHEAVYWSWRAIKHQFKPRGGWQWGVRLTQAERDAIYDLATCPIDNLKTLFRDVKDEESFGAFFFCVYRAYLRHHRSWWRHPRWHFWHWSFQVHPWQKLRRFLFSRCAGCGKGFAWGYSPVSHSWNTPKPKIFGSEVGVFHSECSAMTMKLHRDTPQGNC